MKADNRDGSSLGSPAAEEPAPAPAIQVPSIDPHDEPAIAHWAAQLGVAEATLRQAVAAIGTDVDKVKTWLAARPDAPSAR